MKRQVFNCQTVYTVYYFFFFIEPPSLNHRSGCAHNIIIFASDLYIMFQLEFIYKFFFISLFIPPYHQLITTILYRCCDCVGCRRFFFLSPQIQKPHTSYYYKWQQQKLFPVVSPLITSHHHDIQTINIK